MVTKSCYGGHETRTSVLCYMNGISCGKICDKMMPCGNHRCQRVCHDGPCLSEGQESCSYPCLNKRDSCEHPCALNCHTNVLRCPPSKCKVMMRVTCACGRLVDRMSCSVINDSAARIPTSLMARLKNKDEDSLDVNELLRRAQENKFIKLDCDQTCSVIERNRKLAEALDIKEPDLEKEATPNYPESLKQYTLENLEFVTAVHEELTQLVNDSKRNRTLAFKNHNFPAMRADQRHAIHELAEFFGCKSHGVDAEPNRSVVVKAVKEKCFLPTVSVMDVVRRKNPKNNQWLVLSSNSGPKGSKTGGVANILKNSSTLAKPVSSSTSSKVVQKNPWTTPKPLASQPAVDYFDFNGD